VPQANGDSSKVKVKVRVNINGLFNVSGATTTEKVENPPAAEDQEPMDVDNAGTKAENAEQEEGDKKQPQQPAEEGMGDSPRESASNATDIADVEPADKDAADKVRNGGVVYA